MFFFFNYPETRWSASPVTTTVFRLLVPAFFAALFFACQSQPAPPNPADTTGNSSAPAASSVTTRKTIVFFGNSLTAAYQLPPEQGFPALIQQKVDGLGLAYRCVNAGNSGETTAGGKNRVDWILSQSVDVFVLELGGNDALRGVPVDEAKRNLQEIINRVKTKYPTCQIVLVGMLAPPNLGPTYTKAFAAMYPDLAKANGTALVPFLLEGVGGDPNLNLPDGIHPNEAGHRIVAETVWKTLRPLL
ncbi:MAG: arylesterase [Saprospiraceae bacterium]